MSTVPLDEGPAASCTSSVPLCAPVNADESLLGRFIRDGDEGAFSALVQRHGPMVLGVCQRVLQDRHEAEDAFQATFLLLVQRAASLREPRLLAGWLYGVAYRIAQRARRRAARRNQHERERPPMAAGDPLDTMAVRELRDLLDAELNALPAKYRAALVLCYLDGKTNIEAAHELGWPIGSMSARLARGRELLRERLARRHPALSSSPVPLLLLGFLKPASVGAELVGETVQAMAGLTGQTIAAAAESAASGASAAAPLAAAGRWPTSIILLMIALFSLAGGLIASEWFASRATNTDSTPNTPAFVTPEQLTPASAVLPAGPCKHE